MVRKKDSFWEHAKDLGNGRFICQFCKRDFAGGISRIKAHLAGVKGHDIQICLQVSQAIQLEAQQALEVSDTPTKRAKVVPTSNNVLQGESALVPSSSNILKLGKGQDTCVLDKHLAKFVILEGICFDALQSPHFKNFVNCIAEHGPGYELPSSLTFKSQLISDIEKKVDEYFTRVIKCSFRTGCTLMFNIWTGKFFKISIVMVYTPGGVVCIGPPDRYPPDKEPGHNKISRYISFVIELIGPTNVVQLMINNDNDDDNDEVIVTKDMLKRKYPWIFQTPCATHGIGLLLRKICDVPFVYNTIEVAKCIVLYIYKHKVNVSIRRVHKKKDLIASQFFLLVSLLEVENELQALKVSIETLSSDWGKPLNQKELAELKRGANLIDYFIHCEEFWNRGKMVAQVMQPLFQALYLVNCDAPTSGFLYEMMERVQDAVKKCSDNNHKLYDVICNISSGLSDIIHPLHEVAAFLNPIYMCSEKFEEKDEMKIAVKKFLEHSVAQDFGDQVQRYCKKDPNVFTGLATKEMLQICHPREWWEVFGEDLPILKKYAIRMLSQPCSSSLYKRFLLRGSSLDDREFFMVNAMMMERYKSLGTQIKPIILDKLGEVSDVYYQHLLDEDDDWDHDYANEFSYLTDNYDINIIKVSTGSWLDSWPKK